MLASFLFLESKGPFGTMLSDDVIQEESISFRTKPTSRFLLRFFFNLEACFKRMSSRTSIGSELEIDICLKKKKENHIAVIADD